MQVREYVKLDPGNQQTSILHSSKGKQADAFVEIYYRNTWFWIDDGDLDSKRVFAQLMQLFAMADTGPREESLPVVTIPAH